MKVLWCHSHPVCLVLRVPSPHVLVFFSVNVFVTSSCCFFSLNDERVERWEGKMRGHN